MTDPISRSWRQQQFFIFIAFIPATLLFDIMHWYSTSAQLLESVRVQAAMVGDSASAALIFEDPLSAREVAVTSGKYPQLREVAIYRADGSLLAVHALPGVEIKAQVPPQAPASYRFSLADLQVEAPVRVNGRQVGNVHMRVGLKDFYLGQLQFAGGLGIILAITLGAYAFTSTHLKNRVTKAEDALRHLALHDRVTGMSNRHAFEVMLEQTLKRHQRDGGKSILLFIDVDGFKKVNDLFGHQIGDQVLRQIGQRLQSAIRGSDIVARLGGDEFGAILVDSNHPDDAARIADDLIGLMAEPFGVDGHEAHLGLSIGIAMIPEDGASIQGLQAHADMAMYRAKNEGKNTYRFYSKSLGDEVRARHELEQQLRAALGGDQLYLDYQPQFMDNLIREVCGVEALLRWRHPRRGLISPAMFIPIAEESDLILDIGDWVLRQVLSDIRALDQRGLRMPPVAINVSARQFARRNMVDVIEGELAAFGLTPDRIEIELTESVVMGHSDKMLTTFDAVRASGLRLVIDDFGTGYSSLAYLKRLPVSKLKIDRAFVAQLMDSEEDRGIVTAIINLADAIGLRVVAEGVETEQQAAALQELGCEEFQGYLMGRPASLEQFVMLLAEQA